VLRYEAERSIGTFEQGSHLFGMRYLEPKKGNMEFLLNTTAFNLRKTAVMVE
jgi:hypothetical protein